MSYKNKQCFQGKDSFSRMNFLFQASMLMAGRNQVLSAYYGNLCKNIGKKSVLRMDPELKRSLCKKCSVAQRPGITSNLSIASETVAASGQQSDVDKKPHMYVECIKCGHKRKFKINANLNFWMENPDSIAEATKFKTESRKSVPQNQTAYKLDAKTQKNKINKKHKET